MADSAARLPDCMHPIRFAICAGGRSHHFSAVSAAISSSEKRFRTGLAGTPATMVYGGTSKLSPFPGFRVNDLVIHFYLLKFDRFQKAATSPLFMRHLLCGIRIQYSTFARASKEKRAPAAADAPAVPFYSMTKTVTLFLSRETSSTLSRMATSLSTGTILCFAP